MSEFEFVWIYIYSTSSLVLFKMVPAVEKKGDIIHEIFRILLQTLKHFKRLEKEMGVELCF